MISWHIIIVIKPVKLGKVCFSCLSFVSVIPLPVLAPCLWKENCEPSTSEGDEEVMLQVCRHKWAKQGKQMLAMSFVVCPYTLLHFTWLKWWWCSNKESRLIIDPDSSYWKWDKWTPWKGNINRKMGVPAGNRKRTVTGCKLTTQQSLYKQ